MNIRALLPFASTTPTSVARHDEPRIPGSAGAGADEIGATQARVTSAADRRPIVKAAADAAQGTLSSVQAMPSFLYPSVVGTPEEQALVRATLDRLPMKDRGAIPVVRMVSSLDLSDEYGSPGTVLGLTIPTGDIALSREAIDGPDLLRYVLVHEAGHAHDAQGGLVRAIFLRTCYDKPWGQEPFPTPYAETMRAEDFAEAHAFYHLSPQELERVKGPVHARTTDLERFAPEKWKAMHASEQPDALERLVDSKPFRETGRWLGDSLSTPAGSVVRTALSLASSVSAMLLLGKGVAETVDATQQPDRTGLAEALLDLGAGAALTLAFVHPVVGPAALVLLGARQGLSQAPQGEEKTSWKRGLAATGGALGGVVGGTAGPLGGTLAGYALAGPVGGAIGLVIGTVAGFPMGSTLGAKATLAAGSS